jgi:hypothetical protein
MWDKTSSRRVLNRGITVSQLRKPGHLSFNLNNWFIPLLLRWQIEAGWPNQGVGVGKSGAVGSTGQNSQSQFVAVSNIISALRGNVIVYEAFNDYYVVDTSTRKGQGRFV